jgi:monofunctional biosynthetic peptidoglycan transglycosylase
MKEKNKNGLWTFLKKIFLVLFISHLSYIVICKWIDPPFTITQLVNFFEGYGIKRDYINYDEMGSNIKLAVMASEDQLFPVHNGFDFDEIKEAMKYNEKHPNRTRGASTISQQTAKNVFLWQHGGYFRKGLEVYFTFMIELIWDKKRILENYLNIVEMGKGIFGVQAAAQYYFNKDAKNLTKKEAAMIAACLPNPKKLTVKPPSKYVNYRSGKIMIQMNYIADDAEIRKLLK